MPISLKTKGMNKATTSRNTFGTGPYILQSWLKGVRKVFEANPNWWANDRFPNRPKTLILRPIKEATTRAKALLAGEVDVIMGVMPQFIPQIEADPKTEIAAVPSVRIEYLTMFTRWGGPLADANVRKAINYAIDGEMIRKTIMADRADPIGQLYHPWNFSGYNPDKTWHGYDLAKAKAYMKKSAYPKGFKGEIFTPTGRYPGCDQICEASAGMLKKIGIDAPCKRMNFPLYRKTFKAYQAGKRKGQASMAIHSYGNAGGEAALVMRGTTSCTGAWSTHCFQDIEAQIDKAAATGDPEQQQIAFEKITDMQKEKAIFKILFKVHDVFGYRKGLGFKPRHDETLTPWEVSMPEMKN